MPTVILNEKAVTSAAIPASLLDWKNSRAKMKMERTSNGPRIAANASTTCTILTSRDNAAK
jgi:hypothetical protein